MPIREVIDIPRYQLPETAAGIAVRRVAGSGPLVETDEQWAALVARVQFRPPFVMRLDVSGSRLLLRLFTSCVDTGAPITIAEVIEIEPMPETAALRAIRKMALRILEHELDESLLVDGSSLLDPHALERSQRRAGPAAEHP